MSGLLHIVVTCTDRKKAAIPEAFRLRKIADGPVAKRASAWVRCLSRNSPTSLRATDLYAGDHWKVACELPSLAKRAGLRPRLWVCSAGYGLVPAHTQLTPYAATFARGHEDSVYRDGDEVSPTEAARQWWARLADWEGPVGRHPRLIHELAKRSPRSYVAVVASAAYMEALEEDLAATNAAPNRLLVISAGTTTANGVSRFLLPADARLQRRMGGARQALNVRIARDVLERFTSRPEGFDWIRQFYRHSLAQQEDLVPFNRTPMSDAEVKNFIQSRLRENPKARHTPLLRKFRDGGQACEQKRFKMLFLEVQRELDGQTN